MAVALAGLLIGGAAGVTAWRTSATRSPASADVATPVTARELLAGLPDRLLPPATPTALPTDRAVGRGSLLYQINDPDSFTAASGDLPRLPIYLVTTSGDQFSVGLAATTGEFSQALSPDGRWFAQRRDRQWWIRDLTGITERAVPHGYELRQWSTDGRALLLGQTTGAAQAYTAFTLPGGELRPLALHATSDRRMLAFLDGRELTTVEFTLGPNLQPRRQLTIAIQNVDGRNARSVSIPTTQQVGPGDIRNALVPLIRGGGDPPTVWALVTRQEEAPTGQPKETQAAPPLTLIGVDLRSGQPAGRIDLVAPKGDEGEEFLGLAGTEVLLQRRTADGAELVAADPATGQRRALTSLPDYARVIVPGD
ncbi:hypothetical protein DKT68_13325 [Micromonospora acroterricola]|uniref:Lipoprotein LpqB beta-propeller domain-containing protein n=1 Tax=Micromonospora acroterricola TaxID=2202421 RepID=A0A317D262_9ACTN|nr:hypothetical protein [Micromonospora acroterricola]PWR08971.1 hypothetical protein DKT68_13325 [Micromonospora acroterricola]